MDQTALLQTALGRIWTSHTIADDFATLCSFGGRFAGTESEVRAREWLAQRIAQATGVPTRRESVAYRGWTRGPASIVLPNGRTLPALGLVRTVSTPPHGLTARLVDLGRGTPQDVARAGEAVRGAVVLVRHEFMVGTGHVHRRRKYDAARQAGAAGFLIAFHEHGGLAVTGSSGDGSAGHIPSAGVSREVGAALAAVNGQMVTLRTSGEFCEAQAENLLARIAGSGPVRVVLSAHYDGHDPASSAIDNASGVVAAIAVAEALRDGVASLPRGLELALFTVEEWALIGSRLHLETMTPAEREAIAFNVNLDSVAGGPGLTAITGGFPGVAEFVARAVEQIGVQIGIHHSFMANSDHANFVRQGIPAFRLCAGFNEPSSHLRFLLTAADTPDKVRPDELKTAASVAAALVIAACSDTDLPQRVSAEAGRHIADA
jgi:Zn-dependent M28 family amino/carboxypeptidase